MYQWLRKMTNCIFNISILAYVCEIFQIFQSTIIFTWSLIKPKHPNYFLSTTMSFQCSIEIKTSWLYCTFMIFHKDIAHLLSILWLFFKILVLKFFFFVLEEILVDEIYEFAIFIFVFAKFLVDRSVLGILLHYNLLHKPLCRQVSINFMIWEIQNFRFKLLVAWYRWYIHVIFRNIDWISWFRQNILIRIIRHSFLWSWFRRLIIFWIESALVALFIWLFWFLARFFDYFEFHFVVVD